MSAPRATLPAAMAPALRARDHRNWVSRRHLSAGLHVADVEAAGPAVNGELQVDLDEVDFLAIFPLAKKTRARLIGTVRDVSGLSRPR